MLLSGIIEMTVIKLKCKKNIDDVKCGLILEVVKRSQQEMLWATYGGIPLEGKKFHFKAIIGVYAPDKIKQNLPREKNAANARSKLLSIQKSTASMLFKQTRRVWV